MIPSADPRHAGPAAANAMAMQDHETHDCPYCGEPVTLALDASAGDQSYIEDCQVCCRPMVVFVAFDEMGSPQVTLRREDE
jgi:hypothetical protein